MLNDAFTATGSTHLEKCLPENVTVQVSHISSFGHSVCFVTLKTWCPRSCRTYNSIDSTLSLSAVSLLPVELAANKVCVRTHIHVSDTENMPSVVV